MVGERSLFKYFGFIKETCNSRQSLRRYTGVTASDIAFLNSSLVHPGTSWIEKAINGWLRYSIPKLGV